MRQKINIDNFIKNNQEQIVTLVNHSLNRSGDIIQKKVASGELGSSLQEVLPLLLYEVLVTHTVSTLRLVAEMINKEDPSTEVKEDKKTL